MKHRVSMLAAVYGLLLCLGVARASSAAPTVVQGTGDITAKVAQFRTLLGDPLNGVTTGEQAAGRREINWDAVPAGVTNTNSFPAGFFNSNSPRGLLLSPATGLRVSDNDFNDLNPTYGAQFNAFSPAKTFAAVGSRIVDVTFQVAGSVTPAAVSGFGVVFSDVDRAGSASLEFFQGGVSLGVVEAPARSDANGLSFAGAVFPVGVGITRVRITSGDAGLSANTNDVSDGGTADLVVMDDFLYGEPHADSDGDGVRDTVDQCPGSDLRAKVDANGSGLGVTSVDNLVSTVGCTIQDLVNAAARSATSHKDYIRRINALTVDLQRARAITPTQAKELRLAATASRIGY